MSAIAFFAHVIDTEDVIKFCSQEFHELQSILTEHDTDFHRLASYLDDGDDMFYNHEEDEISEDVEEQIVKKYQALIMAFKRETDASIKLRYHSIEDWGTKYDEVDGWFFAIDNDKPKQITVGKHNIVANLKTWVVM